MNAPLPATYFDGEFLHPHPVTVQLTEDGRLHAVGEGMDRLVSAAEIRISDRLGHVPFFLRLPDRGVIELPADESAVALLTSLRRPGALLSLLHRLESHSAIAATATLVLAIAVACTLWLGLPRLALRAAYAVPVAIEQEAGQAGYAYFARAYPRTQLNYEQRRPAYRALDRLKKTRKLHVEPAVYFFGLRAPNAFALPGGTIVVTDELVRLAENEDELAAVLAHEIGHVENRHGLQSVLRNSSALIVVSTVTGDLSTLSTFSGTLPFLLLEYGYSREFEHEADVFAVGLLRDAHIDPAYLAAMLQKLEKHRPTSGPDFSYLSTHPATADRIQYVTSFSLPAKDPASRVAQLAAAALQPTLPALKFESRLDGPDPHLSFAQGVSLNRATTTRGLSGTMEAPQPLEKPSPVYPENMRRAGVEGEVVVDFVVGTNGRVFDAFVAHSTRAEFDAPALAAVRQWKFKPGMKDGHPASVRMQVPVGFHLTNDNPTLATIAAVTTTSTIPGDAEAAAATAPDSLPYPVLRRPARYPDSLRGAGISGDVSVEFDVDYNGDVMNARVVVSSHPDFDAAALTAVRGWKYQPAVKNSRPVNAHLRETLYFRQAERDPEK